MASSQTADDSRAAAARMMRAMQSISLLSLEEQETKIAGAIHTSSGSGSLDALLALADALLADTSPPGLPDPTVALNPSVEQEASAVDAEYKEIHDTSLCWIESVVHATAIECEVRALLKNILEEPESDDSLVAHTSAHVITTALDALGKQEDVSQGEFLRNQCETLAMLEQQLTHLHQEIVRKAGKEAVKEFDEQILFPLRKAFLHRCASIYLLYDGDSTNLGEFSSRIIKPIYEKAYGEESLKERMAQIRNALMKADIFPAMQSNNAKENQRRGKKRASRQKNQQDEGATIADKNQQDEGATIVDKKKLTTIIEDEESGEKSDGYPAWFPSAYDVAWPAASMGSEASSWATAEQQVSQCVSGSFWPNANSRNGSTSHSSHSWPTPTYVFPASSHWSINGGYGGYPTQMRSVWPSSRRF